MIPSSPRRAGALVVLVTAAAIAAVIAGGARIAAHNAGSANAGSGIVAFEENGRRCFSIPGQPGRNGGGTGGAATICGEGSEARPGGNGDPTERPPTYTIRNGSLVRKFPDGRTEPVEVR